MTLTSQDNHEIFPVLYDYDYENDCLYGTYGCKGCQTIRFVFTVGINQGLLVLNDEESSKWTDKHSDGAHDNLMLKLLQMGLIPIRFRLLNS